MLLLSEHVFLCCFSLHQMGRRYLRALFQKPQTLKNLTVLMLYIWSTSWLLIVATCNEELANKSRKTKVSSTGCPLIQ